MELEIEEKNDNPILQRQEIQIVIKHENKSTPKRNDVIQSLVTVSYTHLTLPTIIIV